MADQTAPTASITMEVDGGVVSQSLGARVFSKGSDGFSGQLKVEGQNGRRFQVSVNVVRIDSGKKHGIVFLPRSRERWDLRLPAELPLRVRIKGAGVGGELDLTASAFEGVEADGVFIGVAARLPAPREDTEIRMKGVFNSLNLSVPEGTPVRVHGPGLPFNAVNRGVRGTEGRPGYDVSVQGIFSAVEVRTDPAISSEPPPVARPADAPAETPHAASPAPSPPHPPAEAAPSGKIG